MRTIIAASTLCLLTVAMAISVGAQQSTIPSITSAAEAPRITPEPPLRAVTLATANDAIDPSRIRPTSGFTIPVTGGVVPIAPELLPNSLRDYRAGIHQGIDFPVRTGTPVLAAAAGRISRIDYAYQEWSEPARNAALDNARRLGYTPELILDLIRGRQVWIDHGDGVVTRYSHLSAVAPLSRGDAVEAGQIVGYVGQSGYPEGGPHLHFEIRTGDTYLGVGVTDLSELRATIARAFNP